MKTESDKSSVEVCALCSLAKPFQTMCHPVLVPHEVYGESLNSSKGG